MEKSETALKTIGEMSKALGVQTHILRYWEEQFTMLNPLKRAGGRRYYRAEDADLLYEINRLIYDEGYTIRGAQKYLRDAKKADINGVKDIKHQATPSALTNMSISNDVRRDLMSIADDLRKAINA